MDLSSILRPAAVKVLASTTSKKRLFQTLGDIVSNCYGLDGDAAFSALQARESLGPTAVGDGVALPHARLEGIDGVVGAFIRVEKPIDFDAVDRQAVDLVFALFAPDGSGVDHLKALALVSRTMRDSGIIAKLRANNDPDTLYTILVEAQGARVG